MNCMFYICGKFLAQAIRKSFCSVHYQTPCSFTRLPPPPPQTTMLVKSLVSSAGLLLAYQFMRVYYLQYQCQLNLWFAKEAIASFQLSSYASLLTCFLASQIALVYKFIQSLNFATCSGGCVWKLKLKSNTPFSARCYFCLNLATSNDSDSVSRIQ